MSIMQVTLNITSFGYTHQKFPASIKECIDNIENVLIILKIHYKLQL